MNIFGIFLDDSIQRDEIKGIFKKGIGKIIDK
jgi:hypothetical protein